MPYKIERDWGSYDVIYCGDGYKLKQMMVKPGGVIQRQMHMLRSEYWIILKGDLKATLDGNDIIPKIGDCIFVDKAVEHTITNVGKDIAEIFEVQIGTCRETDVVYVADEPTKLEGPM